MTRRSTSNSLIAAVLFALLAIAPAGEAWAEERSVTRPNAEAQIDRLLQLAIRLQTLETTRDSEVYAALLEQLVQYERTLQETEAEKIQEQLEKRMKAERNAQSIGPALHAAAVSAIVQTVRQMTAACGENTDPEKCLSIIKTLCGDRPSQDCLERLAAGQN